MSRIQPLNGKISSVTQVHFEAGTTTPCFSAAVIQPVVEEFSACHVTSVQESDNTFSSKINQGGTFPGIGEFSLTSKQDTDPTSQLPLRHREDAMLRCAVNRLHSCNSSV